MSGKSPETIPNPPLGSGSNEKSSDVPSNQIRAQFSSPPALPPRTALKMVPPSTTTTGVNVTASSPPTVPERSSVRSRKANASTNTSNSFDNITHNSISNNISNTNNVTNGPQTSPLLSSTPPTVAKSLIKSYPYLLMANKVLLIFTWTNDDYWINLILLSTFGFTVLYFESLIIWSGHLITVGVITLYSILNKKIIEETNLNPTLDDVVQALTTTCIKADMLLEPITSLSLNAYDIKRLLFTTVFLTPIYLIVSFFIITPRMILLIVGLYIISYHSAYLRVTRKMLWKIKFVRLLCFYLTGLDFLSAKNSSLFAAAFAKATATVSSSPNSQDVSSQMGLVGDGKPVRFTYAIYENQRRWLGIGWTSNLLSYERTPWTDEFLNESSSIESFTLPNAENSSYSFGSEQQLQLITNGASWRWVDKTWRLDLTNDGAITLSNNKRSKTTANPNSDDGYIYFDNVWKKPTTEDSFGKYTRRRRWIRTAELVFNNSNPQTNSSKTESITNIEDIPVTLIDSKKSNESTGINTSSETKSTNRKSLRFAGEDDNE